MQQWFNNLRRQEQLMLLLGSFVVVAYVLFFAVFCAVFCGVSSNLFEHFSPLKQ